MMTYDMIHAHVQQEKAPDGDDLTKVKGKEEREKDIVES